MADNKPETMRGTIFAYGQAKPCIMRSISPTEACLAVFFPDRLPDRFRLYVEDTRSDVDCEVVWRGRKEVGVRMRACDAVGADNSSSSSISAVAV